MLQGYAGYFLDLTLIASKKYHFVSVYCVNSNFDDYGGGRCDTVQILIKCLHLVASYEALNLHHIGGYEPYHLDA